MICPHCNKVIPSSSIDLGTRSEVIRLGRGGYSSRDIQEKLGVSFSSAARILRQARAEFKAKGKPWLLIDQGDET